MALSQGERSEKQAQAELIRERAEEEGEFAISDLSEILIKEGLWGAGYKHLDVNGFRVFRKGCSSEVKASLASEMLAGEDNQYKLRAWWALESGAKARWKLWVHMTRRESRGAIALTIQTKNDVHRSLNRMVAAHNKRFKEDVRKVLREQDARS